MKTNAANLAISWTLIYLFHLAKTTESNEVMLMIVVVVVVAVVAVFLINTK